MHVWRSLVSQFGIKRSRSNTAQLRLTQAYQAVFHGSPAREDQELVLADLLAKSGFSRVTHPSATAAELRQREGMRELYGHIHGHLTLSPSDVRALENAARLEAVADQQD